MQKGQGQNGGFHVTNRNGLQSSHFNGLYEDSQKKLLSPYQKKVFNGLCPYGNNFAILNYSFGKRTSGSSKL